MKNIYGKDINDNTRLTRHYQDWEVELAKPNKDYITTNYFCPRRDVSYDDCLLKLGKLEDIEEELGIDLVLRNRIEQADKLYCKYNEEIIESPYVYTCKNIGVVLFVPYEENCPATCIFAWKDYGKTWALTKDELNR